MNSSQYIKISSDEFYKLGGFSNPFMFRSSQGHFIYKQDEKRARDFYKNQIGVKND